MGVGQGVIGGGPGAAANEASTVGREARAIDQAAEEGNAARQTGREVEEATESGEGGVRVAKKRFKNLCFHLAKGDPNGKGPYRGGSYDGTRGAGDDLQSNHVPAWNGGASGARPTTEAAMNSTADRIPNAPTFNQGMAICLTDAQHAGLHSSLKMTLDGLGGAQSPSGTAPMGKITTAAAGSILAIPGLPAKCKVLAVSKLTGQIASKGLAANQPGRTQQAPLPNGQAATVLRQGHY